MTSASKGKIPFVPKTFNQNATVVAKPATPAIKPVTTVASVAKPIVPVSTTTALEIVRGGTGTQITITKPPLRLIARRKPLERILAMGLTGSGKSYTWLMIAKMLLKAHPEVIFRVIDTDNAIDYMIQTQFPELAADVGGNVYIMKAFTWEEYELCIRWVKQEGLSKAELSVMDPFNKYAYQVKIAPDDWVVCDMADNAWSRVQSHFTKEVFGANIGKHLLEVRKMVEVNNGKGKDGKAISSIVKEAMDGWKDWCVDEETEILTQHGWKRYESLIAGEKVMTLSTTSMKYCWEPIKSIYIGPAMSRKMLYFDGNSHNSLTTLDHRWFVELCDSRGYTPRWVTSETLGTSDRIPMCAPPAEIITSSEYSDAMVEVIAWYVTEGSRSERKYRKALQGTISQSIKHTEEVLRIKAALAKLQPEFGTMSGDIKSNDVRMWYLRGNIMSVIDKLAPNKCPTYEFLLRLTQEQLKLFTDICVMGDGSLRESGQTSFYQSRKDVTEAFEFACILQGLATRTWNRNKDDRFGDPEYYQVSVLKSVGAWPMNAARQAENYETPKATREVVDHDGIVWCPETPSGTWMARRKGKIYFTGNTVINKLYDDFMLPIIYQVPCNVYLTTKAEEIDRTEKDQEIKLLFGDLGVKPAGQKRIGHQSHTIFLMIPGKSGFFITTCKDRANRTYFKKTPLKSFYNQYLFARAGWDFIPPPRAPEAVEQLEVGKGAELAEGVSDQGDQSQEQVESQEQAEGQDQEQAEGKESQEQGQDQSQDQENQSGG